VLVVPVEKADVDMLFPQVALRVPAVASHWALGAGWVGSSALTVLGIGWRRRRVMVGKIGFRLDVCRPPRSRERDQTEDGSRITFVGVVEEPRAWLMLELERLNAAFETVSGVELLTEMAAECTTTIRFVSSSFLCPLLPTLSTAQTLRFQPEQVPIQPNQTLATHTSSSQ